MARTESDVELQEHGSEADRRQRGQVVAQPSPRDAQHQDREDGGARHDRQLDGEPGGELGDPDGDRHAGEQRTRGEQDSLLAEHVGGQVRRPQPVTDAGDDRRHGEAVDKRQVPGAGRARDPGGSPCRPEQRIGRGMTAQVLDQVR